MHFLSDRHSDWFHTLLGLALMALLAITPRAHTASFLFLTGGYFVMFFYWWKYHFSGRSVAIFWFWGILFRVVWLFFFPQLSDDFYRFFWDGKLVMNGINPYIHTPHELSNTVKTMIPDAELVLGMMNSPHYHSVYPPLNQYLFALAALGADIDTFVVFTRVLLIGFDIVAIYGLIRLLRSLRLPPGWAFIYGLHPLLLIEGVGNLHFEGAMMALVIWGVYALVKNKRYAEAGLAWGASALVKSLPLMFAPLWIATGPSARGVLKAAGAGLILLALVCVPFAEAGALEGMLDGYRLYFQRFEFNGSLYRLFRWCGYQWVGYNPIATVGKIMPVLALGGILLMAYQVKKQRLNPAGAWQAVILVYYTFASIVHPWYLITALPAMAIRPYPPIVIWSGTVFLSYALYSDPGGPWTWLEYFPVYVVVALPCLANGWYSRMADRR